MQSIADIRKHVGRERWNTFVREVLKGVNNFELAKRFGVSLWLVRFAKMKQPDLALSIIDEQANHKAVILPFSNRKVA